MERDLVYSSNILSVDDISNKLDELWLEIQQPYSQLRRQALEAGINLDALQGMNRDEVVSVERPSSGFADTELLIFIGKAMAPVVAKIAIDLWNNLLLPRIRRDKGEDALVEGRGA